MTEQHALFDPLLQDLSDRSRDEVLAAFSAVQYAAHPGQGQGLGYRDVSQCAAGIAPSSVCASLRRPRRRNLPFPLKRPLFFRSLPR